MIWEMKMKRSKRRYAVMNISDLLSHAKEEVTLPSFLHEAEGSKL